MRLRFSSVSSPGEQSFTTIVTISEFLRNLLSSLLVRPVLLNRSIRFSWFSESPKYFSAVACTVFMRVCASASLIPSASKWFFNLVRFSSFLPFQRDWMHLDCIASVAEMRSQGIMLMSCLKQSMHHATLPLTVTLTSTTCATCGCFCCTTVPLGSLSGQNH